MEIYLDNAATTKVCDEAADAALAMMTKAYGNPSSTHAKGREAKKALDLARAQVADALGCTPAELVFTSCGSEADNWAIIRGAESARRRGGHIISSTVEHDAVRKSLDALEKQGFEVTRLSPGADGSLSAGNVLAVLRPDTVLVSLMMVNNETGAVTDIADIFRKVKDTGSHTLLHTDAVQGFLKVPFSAKTLGADMISLSGHKIHAPKGIGALYVREGLKIAPYLVGGGQEDGRRAGTEAMPLIAAFGAAAAAGKAQFPKSAAHMASLRGKTLSRLKAEIPGLTAAAGGAPHILSVSLPGYRSEVLMNYLEARGIFVSKSSACKKGGRSHVLEAMGLPPRVIDGTIRIGFSRFTTEDEVREFCGALRQASETLAHT